MDIRLALVDLTAGRQNVKQDPGGSIDLASRDNSTEGLGRKRRMVWPLSVGASFSGRETPPNQKLEHKPGDGTAYA